MVTSKKYKVLMIGLGSIGQRHVRNLRRVLGDRCEISAYRVRRLQQTFSDTMQIRDGVNLEEEYHIKVFEDLEEALDAGPDLVFVTNITSKHMECALAAARKGCHIFLEKPVSDSLEGVEELLRLQKEKGLHIFMGYQNRYHPCVKKMIEYLEKDALGKLVSVDAAFCERLTTMHTYEDYSTTYMARKEMGGGPILNLQIHDLDYLQWIFGMPISLFAIADKHSNLKIDVEDHAVINYVTKFKGANLTVTSRSDFLQYPPVHTCKVVGEKGRIELDFNKAVIRLIPEDGIPIETEYKDFVRNDMFLMELEDCISCIEHDIPDIIPLTEGIKGLQIAMAAKNK